jgi:predicted membrane protein
MAMGEAHLDLSRLTVDQAAVDFGMGMVTLELPTQSSADLTIDGGIGQVVINAPEGVGVRIRDEAGLVAKTVPAGYVHNGNVYESPGYKDAERQVTLRVSLGIGSLHVRER